MEYRERQNMEDFEEAIHYLENKEEVEYAEDRDGHIYVSLDSEPETSRLNGVLGYATVILKQGKITTRNEPDPDGDGEFHYFTEGDDDGLYAEISY